MRCRRVWAVVRNLARANHGIRERNIMSQQHKNVRLHIVATLAAVFLIVALACSSGGRGLAPGELAAAAEVLEIAA